MTYWPSFLPGCNNVPGTAMVYGMVSSAFFGPSMMTSAGAGVIAKIQCKGTTIDQDMAIGAVSGVAGSVAYEALFVPAVRMITS